MFCILCKNTHLVETSFFVNTCYKIHLDIFKEEGQFGYVLHSLQGYSSFRMCCPRGPSHKHQSYSCLAHGCGPSTTAASTTDVHVSQIIAGLMPTGHSVYLEPPPPVSHLILMSFRLPVRYGMAPQIFDCSYHLICDASLLIFADIDAHLPHMYTVSRQPLLYCCNLDLIHPFGALWHLFMLLRNFV